jgi:hypothetical protein
MTESAKKKDKDITSFVHDEARIKEVKIESPEDPDDKKLRLEKERWTFYVKDLAAYVLSFLFVLLIGLYCLFVVARYGVASAEAKLVLPLITSLFGGVVGMVIGRASK